MTPAHPLTTLCPSWVPAVPRAFQTQCPSAEAVREVVLTHLHEKEVLDSSLPSSIIIGPFYISVDNVKQSLSKKRKALATSMLDILAKNLHKEVDDVSACLPGPSDCSSMCTHACRVRLRGVDGRVWKSPCLNPAKGPHERSQEVGAALCFPGLVQTWGPLTRNPLRRISSQS